MIKVYFIYKIHQLKEYIKRYTISSVSDIKKIKTWFRIYFAIFLSFIAYYYIYGFHIGIWYGMIILLIGLIIGAFYKDYISGEHIHWYRINYMDKALNTERTKDFNETEQLKNKERIKDGVGKQ